MDLITDPRDSLARPFAIAFSQRLGVSWLFDEWLSETTLSRKWLRESNERDGQRHEQWTFHPLPSSLPALRALPPSGSTRSIFYRITGIVASAPAAPRRSPLNVHSPPVRPPTSSPSSEPNTIPRGLNIDCDSDL